MVPIKSIKTTSCPVCGCATIVLESVEVEFDRPVIRCHGYGGQWETRKFACGYEVHYDPNFHKEKTSVKCKTDPAVLSIKKKTAELKASIFELVDKSDLPDYLKGRFTDNIRWIGGGG